MKQKENNSTKNVVKSQVIAKKRSKKVNVVSCQIKKTVDRPLLLMYNKDEKK